MARTPVPTMQLLTGYVEINQFTTIYRGVDDPLTPAEVLVLQIEHGEDAVHDLVWIDDVERSTAEEYDRLAAIYKRTVLEQAFPGAGSNRLMARVVEGAENGRAAAKAMLRRYMQNTQPAATPAMPGPVLPVDIAGDGKPSLGG